MAKNPGDMTLEALGQKMMYALGKANHKGLNGKEKLDYIDTIIRKPYNGDISVTELRK